MTAGARTYGKFLSEELPPSLWEPETVVVPLFGKARHRICLEMISRNYDRLNVEQVVMSGRFYLTPCDSGRLVWAQLSEHQFLETFRFWEATNVAVLRGKTAPPKTCGSVPSLKAADVMSFCLEQKENDRILGWVCWCEHCYTWTNDCECVLE